MKQRLFLFIVCAVMVTSCRWTPFSQWDDEVTVKEEKIRRFDRVVDEFVSLNSYSALQSMNTEYPRATRLLIEEVLCIGSVEEVRIDQRLREFYQDSTMQVLLEDVHKTYATMAPEEKEIYSVFHQIKDADPAFRIPVMYTQVSGLNQSIVVGDSVLGISLDKYLGSDYPLYNAYYYDWQRRMMDRRRIVPDALFYYLSHEYPLPSDRIHTLLDYMLDYAKLHWIIASCRGISLSQEADLGKEREEWCLTNEGRIWNLMKERGALDSSDMTVVRSFMQPRPDASVIIKGAPDLIGLWVGLRIMDSYVKSHPKVTVGDLLYMFDYNRMLEESGYNPSYK